ncbi:MAG: pseudouridine synthase [Phycisphaerae bacterium]
MGLLLMTNDGELLQRLAHPRYGVPKTYRATCAGRVTPQTLERLRGGVWLSERTGPAEASVIHREPESTVLGATLREGRNREVRRVPAAKLGHPVRRLESASPSADCPWAGPAWALSARCAPKSWPR